MDRQTEGQMDIWPRPHSLLIGCFFKRVDDIFLERGQKQYGGRAYCIPGFPCTCDDLSASDCLVMEL